jgi:hypothetical protein
MGCRWSCSKPLPGTRRWDRKAIDFALDKVSGIPPAPVSKEDQEEEEWQQWHRAYEARNAARELDPEYIRKKAAREAALAKRRGRRKRARCVSLDGLHSTESPGTVSRTRDLVKHVNFRND